MPTTVRQSLLNLLEKTPLIGSHVRQYRTYRQIPHPPGHYYSVIPDLKELDRHRKRIYENREIKGISLQEGRQMELLQELKKYYSELPYDFAHPEKVAEGSRYRVKDAFYRNSDAIFLYSLLRHFKPKRIVEIGSGHSSALMLDTAERFLEGDVQFTFIEPFPEERLAKVLLPKDNRNVRVVPSLIQEADPAPYLELQANDMLFVDSSHVSKIGSDVNFIFFEILPRLQPGVLIHFHDIFFPFELPEKWVTGRQWFWNENYMLRSFLMNNPDFEIVLFNDLLHKQQANWFKAHMPQCLIDAENTGCIWIRKIR